MLNTGTRCCRLVLGLDRISRTGTSRAWWLALRNHASPEWRRSSGSHGYAHAAEIPAGAGVAGESVAEFIAGMLLTTSLLHAAGVVMGAATKTNLPWLARFWGVPVAIVGLMGLSGL